MSPEQVRGEPGGTRSDLWAFGCVLFELLAARRAFTAPTMAETIAAVLMTDPDWHALPNDTPNAVRDLLRRCLDKDPQRRVQDVTEILAALDRARREGPATRDARDRERTIRSLAVLPFVNTSGDAQMDYLGDGITESLILGLSRLPLAQGDGTEFGLSLQRPDGSGARDRTYAGCRSGAHWTRAAARQRAADLGGAGRRRGLADLGRAVSPTGG